MTSSLSNAAVGCATIVDVLRARAMETPDRRAFAFLGDGENEDGSLTYRGLDARARAIAAELQARGGGGERALLLHPPGLDFVAAFYGCLYAGVIAVPAYPPRANRPDPRIQEIVVDARARFALTTSDVQASLQPRLSRLPGLTSLEWLATDTVPDAAAAGWRESEVRREGLALLQYTSGSTVAPKGVMISHGNVMHHCVEVDRAVHQTSESVVVSWLPHFHDMGLFYAILYTLHGGFPAVLMPPAAFLQRPLRWLRAVSRYGATLSGGPNFGFDLCTTRITPEERSTLDLSRWEVAFNGAEPLRYSTLEAFARAFAPCGLRWEALSPAYGMAEATLMVTISNRGVPPVACRASAAELERNRVVPVGASDAGARLVVGCGPLEKDPRVAIVDPQTSAACPDGTVGEIWVSGPSVAQGYWNRPEETDRTFRATLASGEGHFMRTGDLGFVLDGELFVTGRLKDLVIVRGLNHYPQDIELTVERAHPGLRPSAGAAFSVQVDEEERLVVVQEVERVHRNSDLAELAAAIRRAVTEEHEVEPYAVVLIRPATILKTSSGKIQRRASRAAFLDGTLSVLHEWRRSPETRPEPAVAPPASAAPRTEADITSWLVSRLSRESGLDADEIDLDQPFASFGLDSARALVLVGDLETWLGRRLPPIVLWNYPTVEALARHLAA